MRGVAWYDSLFLHATDRARVYGESSTSYSVWEPALVRIKQEIANVKVILVVRDPLERLLSHYRWMYALGLETETLEEALISEQNSPISPDIHRSGCYPWYRRTSNYSHFVPLIKMVFGEENVLCIRTENLAAEPQAVLSHCFRFLNLSDYSLGGVAVKSNTTDSKRVVRGARLGHVYRYLPSAVRDKIKPFRARILELLGTRKLTAQVPSSETLAQLRLLLRADFDEYSRVDYIK